MAGNKPLSLGRKQMRKSISESFRLFAGVFLALVLLGFLLLLPGCTASDAGQGSVVQDAVAGAMATEDLEATPARSDRAIDIKPMDAGTIPITVYADEEEVVYGETFYITTAGSPALPGYDTADHTITFTIENTGAEDLSDLSVTLTSILERTTPEFEITQPLDTELQAGGSPYYSTTFTAAPVIGLAPGTYTDIVRIDYDELDTGAGEFAFEISFTVAAPIVDAQTPNITGQPQNVTVNVGGAAGMSVAASVTDGGSLSYQWFSNTANSNTGGTAVGTGPSFSAPTANAGTTYYYVVVTNTNTSVNGQQTAAKASGAASVTVNAAPTPPPPPPPPPPAAPTPIVNVGIDITAPASGNTPVQAATISNGSGLFTAGQVTWSPGDPTFAHDTRYTATVTLTAAAGHTFTGGLTGAVTINGSNATITNNGNTAILSFQFPATSPAPEPPPATVPGAPQNFATTAGDGQVALSWSAPESDGDSAITGYQVSSNGGASWTPLGVVNTHTFTELTNGTSLTFMVRAINSVGLGPAAISTATPSAPSAPDQGESDTTAPESPSTGTVPADDGSVMVGFTMEGSSVILDLNQNTIDEILGSVEGDIVNIDMTGLVRAHEAVKPVAALAQFAEAGLSLELIMPQGTVLFDAAALASIAQQAEEDNVSFLLNQAGRSELTQDQRNALSPDDLVFSIRLTSGTVDIRSFDGALMVTLPYSGPLPAVVWYLDGGGNLERMDCAYDAEANTVSFMTSHLSFYVVGPDPDAVSAPINGGQGGDPGAQARVNGNLPLLIILIGAAAVVAVFGIRKIRAGSN